jgi:hypothetical protein
MQATVVPIPLLQPCLSPQVLEDVQAKLFTFFPNPFNESFVVACPAAKGTLDTLKDVLLFVLNELRCRWLIDTDKL